LTHHDPDLGEATTFPHIVYFDLSAAFTFKWFFVPGLPKRNLEIVPVWISGIL
jgi:hypothetical protein